MSAYKIVEVRASRSMQKTGDLKPGFYIIDASATGADLLLGKAGWYFRYNKRDAAEQWIAERDAVAKAVRK
jgi:hypothetical protein